MVDGGQSKRRGNNGLMIPVGLFGGLVAAAVIVPATPVADLIFCPSRALTSIDCPGCGMTRSVTSFVRGEWSAAFHYHAGGPLLILGLGVFAGLRVGDRLAGRTVLAGLRRRFEPLAPIFWSIALVAVLLYWLVRLVG